MIKGTTMLLRINNSSFFLSFLKVAYKSTRLIFHYKVIPASGKSEDSAHDLVRSTFNINRNYDSKAIFLIVVVYLQARLAWK
jgi:hypothetical protein